MYEQVLEALQNFFNTMLIPAILGGGAYVINLVSKFFTKRAKQLEVKSELDNMAKNQEIKNKLLAEIKTIVDTNVGSNMQLADAMKDGNGGFLTDDQSVDIKATVTDLVYASLPPSLTEEDGVLLEMIGGPDRLDTIISSMIDRAVYEYKLRKKK